MVVCVTVIGLVGMVETVAASGCGVSACSPAASGKTAVSVAQTTCPMGCGPVDKSAYADHDGKRVYFCSKKCAGHFVKSAHEHIQKMEASGVKLEKIDK